MVYSCAMDQLEAIRLFIRVVDLGSFSKAAVDLRIGQPAATKRVAQLEKQLGARLLHRSTHGVTPTEIGLLYYEKCKLIAHHVDEAETVTGLLQSQVQGVLRVSTSVAFGRRVLVPLLMRFMREHPQLQIELNFEDRYVNLVEQGMDVAIRMGRLEDSTLGARFLGINPWVVVGAPDYLARRGVPQQLADLADPDKLWTLGAFGQLDLPPEKRRQLDAGIALRRHEAHVNDLLGLLGTGKSLLLTPLSENGTAIMTTRTPAAHRKLVECRKKPNHQISGACVR